MFEVSVVFSDARLILILITALWVLQSYEIEMLFTVRSIQLSFRQAWRVKSIPHNRNVVAWSMIPDLERGRQLLGAEGMCNSTGKEAELVRTDIDSTVGQPVQENVLNLVEQRLVMIQSGVG